ncbi:MAG: hypothetical protein RR142_11090 [Clostridia bacterium]
MKQKLAKQSLLVLVALFVVYSLVVFVVPFVKDGTFWLSYLFTTLAFAMQLYIFWLSFRGEGGVRSKLYGIPVARIGLLYGIAQLVLGLVAMALGFALTVPAWIPFLVYMVLFAAALVGVVATDAMRDEIQHQDNRLQAQTAAMRALQSHAAILPTKCKDEALQKAAAALSESIRYSDPVSSAAVFQQEADLTACMDELEKAIVEEDTNNAKILCQQAGQLLAERNRLCKLSKASTQGIQM